MFKTAASSEPPIAFLFPGQGSQHYQMGRELFEGEPDFRERLLALDRDYARAQGVSLVDHLYGSTSARVPLDDIRLSFPMVVLLEYCLAMTLSGRGLRPSLLIGSSAGEYAAHAFAGRISIGQALEMVTEQARCATEHVGDGFLLAVMESPTFYEAHADIRALAQFAGVSFPGAIVLAGMRGQLAALETLLRAHGSTYQVLPVRVPFHSAWVDPAQQPWLNRYEHITMQAGRLPILGQCPAPGAQSYAQALWSVVREPLDFPSVIAGLDVQTPYLMIDVGPAGTLANWVRYGAGRGSAWQTVGLLSPWGGDLGRFRKLCAPTAARSFHATPHPQAGVLP